MELWRGKGKVEKENRLGPIEEHGEDDSTLNGEDSGTNSVAPQAFMMAVFVGVTLVRDQPSLVRLDEQGTSSGAGWFEWVQTFGLLILMGVAMFPFVRMGYRTVRTSSRRSGDEDGVSFGLGLHSA